MKFAYVAMNAKGEEVTGIVTAVAQSEAISKVRSKGLFPTRVTDLNIGVNAPKDRTVEVPPPQEGQDTQEIPVETRIAIDTLASSCSAMMAALVARGFARSEAMEMVKVFLAQAMSMGVDGQKDS